MNLQTMSVLSDADIDKIHAASLEILGKTGIRVEHPEALEMLRANGADVDAASETAKLPPELVEKCLASVPATFDLYDRNGENPLTIGSGVPHLAAGHNAVFVIDADTTERRTATVRDVEDFAAIADALSDIDIVGVPVTPQDVSSVYGLGSV
ncbi:MAG: trimethylamine methyltransferase family protein [Planctomycetes bacterium]|nr:trimethylamine methyltransferase family protein [Planctomycetota bacterium]